MTRNLKALGLALVASLAMSAMVAAAAQANPDVFRTHEGQPVELTAEALQDQVFTVDGGDGEVICDTVDVRNGTVTDGSTTATVEPVYNNEENTCQAKPIGSARVTTNGCHYQFSGETDANGHAPVDITGCDGPGIVIDAALGCQITVPEQTVSGVSYVNVGSTPDEHITLVPTVTGIDYSVTFACILAGINDADDGTYVGNVTVTGWGDNGAQEGHTEQQVGIWVETQE